MNLTIDAILSAHGIGGGNSIKSLQSGSVTFASTDASKTITLSSVDTTKAVVMITQWDNGGIGGTTYQYATAEITNSTTLTLSRGTAGNNNFTVSWTVIEFNNVKSLQKGTFAGTTVTPSTEQTITISAVGSKALVFVSYSTTTASGNWLNIKARLVNSTTIGVQQTVNIAMTYKWQVIEFN